ncbi:hypothetical protein D9758_004917 [Tetrapyrgos nigripes]|uniref:Uncharacterized protein n=1 Tax=Tetrapyrgos nigripes TaxID=182062 RepID=A0A8H5LW49_9AGAR|nr:hypothetical protein D9758_004917 [Tetrapyrgos nigripes]
MFKTFSKALVPPLAPEELEGVAMEAVMADTEMLEPKNLAEAKQSKDWLKWEKAIQEEMDVLMELGTKLDWVHSATTKRTHLSHFLLFARHLL